MKTKWTTNKIRRAWLDFWKSKEHFEVPSKSLIPVNDPSLIWINSGVATLKKYFSGIENPPAPRLTNSQKAIRTNDIENVGLTSRHHTFFEMLGNFSIGDYFKKEAITWGFELLTKVFEFPLDKLYFTVFKDDNDAYDTWVKCGVDPSHITKCDKDRNFWDVGQGPCGPCTEIYYDRGPKYDPKNIGIELFKKDIENDRYVEIWNIVFSQFNNDGKNNYTELAHKNIDTGCGLERLACVLQDTYTNFEIDIFQDIIKSVSTLTKFEYKPDNYLNPSKEQTAINYAYRIITDHVKATCFAVADGALPGNTGRGYIIRKLIRRAIVYAHKLGINNSIIKPVASAVIQAMKDYYPYLEKEQDKVIAILEKEESQFKLTLKKGMDLFEHAVKNNKIPGDVAFNLLDTYGFPIELTQEIAKAKNVNIDMDGFKKCQEEHSKISKTNGQAKAMAVQNATLMDLKLESAFDYDSNQTQAKVIGIFDQDFNVINKTIAEKHNWLVFDKTVIYANCGGEVSDWGWIEADGIKYKVYDAIKGPNGQHFHSIIGQPGKSITLNTNVKISLDEQAKKKIQATHTCEHMMQAALQQTVSKEIKQMGALKNHHKLTYDFQYSQKLTDDQLIKVENLINDWINQALPVTTYHKTLEEAQAMGALAYFEEVYAKVKGKLRVVSIGNISTEICAGRHVTNTKDIGQFHILKLSSKGSGLWRIEAIASNENTIKTINKLNSELKEKIDKIIRTTEAAGFNGDVLDKIKKINLSNNWKETKSNCKLFDELAQQLEKEMVEFKFAKIKKDVNDFINNFKLNEQPYNTIVLHNVDNEFITILSKQLLDKYKDNGFVILNITSKLSYVVCKSAKANISKCNDVIKQINKLTNGRGGGKENFCQGSTQDIQTKDKIINLISQIK